MTTFYYLAVSTDDNRRTTGNIQSASEATARAELNRMGLSILSISTEPFTASADEAAKIFHFEALDRQQKVVDGTIEAVDRVAAYERLTTEFQFSVRYIYLEGASDSAIAAAQQEGVHEILKEQAARAVEQATARRSTLKGSLIDLVQRAEKKMSGSEASTDRAARLVEESAREAADQARDKKQSLEALATETALDRDLLADDASPAARDRSTASEPQHYNSADASISSVSDEAAAPTPDEKRQAVFLQHTVYSLINQLILPDALTRGEAAAALWQRVCHALHTTDEERTIGQRIAAFARLFLQVLLGTLAGLYFLLFAVAAVAARYDWGGISLLARSVTQQSTMVPFLAFSFLMLFATLQTYPHFHRHAGLSTTGLMLFIFVMLGFAGANLLY